jgi:hypothetical protein
MPSAKRAGGQDLKYGRSSVHGSRRVELQHDDESILEPWQSTVYARGGIPPSSNFSLLS